MIKRLFLLSAAFLLLQPAVSEAGWLDKIKSSAQGIVDRKIDNAVNETEKAIEDKIKDAATGSSEEVKTNPGHPSITTTNFPSYVIGSEQNKSEEKIDNNKLIELYGGNTLPWNIAPADSLKAIDTEVKGLHLGMPAIIADQILAEQGFEKDYSGNYVKEIVEVDGKVSEMTPSQIKEIPYGTSKKVLKRYFITLRAIEPSDAFLQQLSGSQKSLIEKAKKLRMAEAKKEQADSLARARQRQRGGNSPQASKLKPRDIKLIYHIEYRQAYLKGAKFDQDAILEQLRNIFGEPNYNFAASGRSGSAFSTGKNWLIYHDAAHMPIAKKEKLLELMPRNYRHGFKTAFIHPCGGKDTKNCVTGAAVSGAFPDDLELQLEAAQIKFAPVMMIEVRSPNVRTMLSWEYLHSEKSIRGYYAKQKAREAQPTATVDF